MGTHLQNSSSASVKFKRLLRQCIVVTSVPPLVQAYRSIYRAAIWFTVFLLRRYPGIRAIYLQRGCAKGEITPGISDIDIGLIVESDAAEIARFSCAYQRLVRWTGFMDEALEVYDEETLYRLFRSDYQYQYRFTEGKAAWKLLYGTDYLQRLPALTDEQSVGGCVNEINLWWAIFAEQTLQEPADPSDTIGSNSICYKVLCEMMKLNYAIKTGSLIFSRSEGFERGLPLLDAPSRTFAQKLQGIAQNRFLASDQAIREETLAFLLRFLTRFYAELRSHPFAAALSASPLRIDYDPQEGFQSEAAQEHITRLVQHLQQNWNGAYRSLYLVPSAFWHIDDLLFLIETEPECPPTVVQLSALVLWHQEEQRRLHRRIHLFLLFPEVALELTTERRSKRGRSILFSRFMPDAFVLMNRPASVLQGEPHRAMPAPVWTHYAERYLGQWKGHRHWRDCAALLEQTEGCVSDLDFLRSFWKALQLMTISNSVPGQEIVFPLTLPALDRAMRAAGIPLPAQLEPLREAYWREVAGNSGSIQALIPDALAFLREAATLSERREPHLECNLGRNRLDRGNLT
jgi:predicted nucleotidyltransferase